MMIIKTLKKFPQRISVSGRIRAPPRPAAGFWEREGEAWVAAGQLAVCVHAAHPGGGQRAPAPQAQEDRGSGPDHDHWPGESRVKLSRSGY